MFANGEWPVELLVEVEPGNLVSAVTAAAWYRMKAAASSDGVRLSIADPAGAYRPLWMQADMRNRPWLYNLSSVSKAKLALPGRSGHGNADTIDVVGSLSWMLLHAADYGFTRPLGRIDPNHWRHDGTSPAHLPAPAPTRKKNPMLLYQIADNDGTNWLVVFNGKARILTAGADTHEWEQIKALHGNPVAVSTRALFNKIATFYGAARA